VLARAQEVFPDSAADGGGAAAGGGGGGGSEAGGQVVVSFAEFRDIMHEWDVSGERGCAGACAAAPASALCSGVGVGVVARSLTRAVHGAGKHGRLCAARRAHCSRVQVIPIFVNPHLFGQHKQASTGRLARIRGRLQRRPCAQRATRATACAP
jgi:hypothetical protein